MKSPKKYLDNYRLIGMRELLSNMIEEVQKDAYNQSILDVENITPEGWISIVEVKKLKIK